MCEIAVTSLGSTKQKVNISVSQERTIEEKGGEKN